MRQQMGHIVFSEDSFILLVPAPFCNVVLSLLHKNKSLTLYPEIWAGPGTALNVRIQLNRCCANFEGRLAPALMLLNSGAGKDSWESLGHQGDLMSEAERIVSLLLENNKLWHYSEGLWPFPGLGSNYQNLYQMQICFFLPSKKDELPPITFLEFQIFSSSTPNQSLLPKGLGSIDSTLALRKWNLR